MKKTSTNQGIFLDVRFIRKIIFLLGALCITLRVVDSMSGLGIIPASSLLVGGILLLLGLLLLLSDSSK